MVQKSFIWKLIQTVAHQWWFLPLILLPQLIPPYASHGYKLLDWGKVNAYILTHPIKGHFTGLFLYFQIIPLTLLTVILLTGKRVTRLFSAYVGLSYTLIAFFQSVSISDQYGFAIVTANVITFLVLASLWFWESISRRNEFEPQKIPAWKYWILLPALLAFWFPVNPSTLTPDFNPVYMLTSGTGLSFCMVTPLYLAILVIHFPHVNKSVFLATGFVGIFMGLGNFVLEFVMVPSYWWIGILHIPLFAISFYSLALSFNEIAGQVKEMASTFSNQ